MKKECYSGKVIFSPVDPNPSFLVRHTFLESEKKSSLFLKLATHSSQLLQSPTLILRDQMVSIARGGGHREARAL